MTLLAGLTALSTFGGSTPGHAIYATDGEGLHKSAIDWFEWGEPSELIPADGLIRTNTRTLAGQTLATTCTVSNIESDSEGGGLRAYRSGQFGADGLDDLYNVGGTGAANQMVAGLANTPNRANVSFHFSCSATLNGVPIPLEGLVVADAETSTIATGHSVTEYIEATPDQASATWRIIDRYRSPGCSANTQAILDANGTLRLQPDGTHCGAEVQGSGPMAVGFMEGATSAQVTLQGGGVSAVALGVVLQTDFGDAPASYGVAGAIFNPSWQGGTVPIGTTPVSGSDFSLGTPAEPLLRLGETIDGEVDPLFSHDALGDDNTEVSDEDAIALPGSIAVRPGGDYVLDDVICHTGPSGGFVAGWIDWNRNGVFDEGERSNVVPCEGGSVSLHWTVPDDVVASTGDTSTFLRLRIAGDVTGASSPVGITTSGEVEDYALNVELPDLVVEKSSNFTPASRPGDVITYEVTATNRGGSPYSSANPAVVFDDLTGLLDDADFDVTSLSADPPGDLGYDAPLISWTGELGPGEAVTITYDVRLKGGGDGTVRNVAWSPEDPEDREPPEQCLEDDPRCDEVVDLLPKLTIDKITSADAFSGPGDTIGYTITVTNPGPGDFTAANPATMTDNLTDVLASGEIFGAVSADVGEISVAGNVLSWSGALAAGERAIITYEVEYTATYENEQDATLENTACIPEEHVAQGAEACATVQTPGPILSQWKTVEFDDDPIVAGSVLTYTLFFENSGDSPLALDAIDRLDFILDDADVTTEPSSDDLTVARDGQEISVTGTIPAGDTFVVTYQVTTKADGDRGDSIATNFLLNAGEDPPTDGRCVPTNDERPDCTTTPVSGSMLIEKRGQGPTGDLPLTGAAFSLITPGGDTVQITDESTQGVFFIEGLAPGNYTLTETEAPEGHMLLAEEITFQVLPSGVVAADETATTRVESDGAGTFRLIITDLEAFTLPLSGGAGNTPWILGGLLLAGLALTAPLVRVRREQLTLATRA